MNLIDHILIPTDFSEDSEKACRVADKMLSSGDGTADLLHVIPNTILHDEQIKEAASVDINGKNARADGRELYPMIFNEAELKLKKLMKNHFHYANRGKTYVTVDRSPARTIADKAWNGNYSMIIMSAKGKHESGWFRGSTTEEVIRSSRAPVLSVFDSADTLEKGRIIIPVDGSLLSMSAIPAAVMIASIFHATITFLYVHEVLGLFSNTIPDKPDDQKTRRTHEYLMDQLMNFIDTAKPHGLHVIDSDAAGLTGLLYDNREIGISFDVLKGYSAHHEITSYANQYADMVVMATHGRSGLAHMLLGSHAEKVALNTQKTVLTVRPDPEIFEQQNA